MLGLLSRDPHFCSLMEVKFGPSSKKNGGNRRCIIFLPLQFFLDYIRIYLFYQQRVIDDFVLLSVFVRNDCLLKLPYFHIHENCLELRAVIWLVQMISAYVVKSASDVFSLVTLANWYLNESGTINIKRLQVFLDELGQ